MLSEIYWSFFTTSVITCILGMLRMAYKSKCSTVDFCCIKIIRDTAIEFKEDEMELEKKEGEVKV